MGSQPTPETRTLGRVSGVEVGKGATNTQNMPMWACFGCST